MPPVTTKTSVGMETPEQTLERSRTLLANSQTPKTVASTGIKVDVPKVIPSTDLAGDTTMGDVMARRAELETIQNQNAQFDADYQSLTGRINAPLTGTPISNPDDFINRFLLNRPTETQTALDQTYQNQAQNTRDFANEYKDAGTQAREDMGMTGLQESLAGTRTRIAERTTKLRETLRDFETNAERRGVAREFVDSEKQKVLADATAELADLAIIESAQLGNLTQAQAEVDRILAEKSQAFALENAAIQQEITRLERMDTRESNLRSGQLQIALQERNRNIQTALGNEKESRSYLIQAAANGADQGTLDAIRNAQSPQEAAFLAGPWVGRLGRMQAQASIRASNASAALNEAELAAFNKAQEDAAAGLLSPDQVKTANELNKDFESQPIVKAYNGGLQKYIVLEDTLANGIDGIQDLQLVYEFMKAVDPTSVVRETEFENAAETGNIFQGTFARFNKAFGTGGFLPSEVKDDFIRAARASFDAKNSQYFNVKSEYANRINNTIGTTNGADYLTAYEGAAPLTESDFELSSAFSSATSEDIQDIMNLTEGLVGVTKYK